jgi:hypothetical protein
VIGEIIAEEELIRSNPGFVASLIASHFVSSKGKGVTDGPERNSATTRVKHVPQNHVLDVLGPDEASTKHGKADLHGKHKSATIQQEEGVQTISNSLGGLCT